MIFTLFLYQASACFRLLAEFSSNWLFTSARTFSMFSCLLLSICTTTDVSFMSACSSRSSYREREVKSSPPINLRMFSCFIHASEFALPVHRRSEESSVLPGLLLIYLPRHFYTSMQYPHPIRTCTVYLLAWQILGILSLFVI